VYLAPGSIRVQFGPFELDLQSGELSRLGRRVRLQGQSFLILTVLIERAGEVVTRDELQQRVWPADTYVDFEHGLNNAIKRLREALNDSSEKPRYIETLPRKGYRFIAELTQTGSSSKSPAPAPAEADVALVAGRALTVSLQPEQSLPARSWRWKAFTLVATLALTAAAAVIARQTLQQHVSATPMIHSIAVLPLNNLSGDPAQEYFADGTTLELITTLTKISRLRVISWTSVRGYKNTTKTLPEIAKELNVDEVIEGSVERSGDRVKITARLIDAPGDHNLWAGSYNRDLRDILSLQEEVAGAIGREVGIALTPQDQTRLSSVRPVNPEAYQFYLRGQSYIEKWTPAAMLLARQCFNEAIEKDPNYARAYAGLVDSYLLGVQAMDPKVAIPTAREAATKAIALDDTVSDAHVALAIVKYEADWDWAGAEKEFQRAIELNPGDTLAHHMYSHLLLTLGRNQESLTQSELYIKADPLSASSHGHLGWHYECTGQYDLALEQQLDALGYDPDFDAFPDLGMLYRYKGMPQEALAQYEKAAVLVGNSVASIQLVRRAYEADGWRGYWSETLRQDLGAARHGFVSPYNLAKDYALTGDKENAFRYLELAYVQRRELVLLPTDHDFDLLHADPRYRSLLQRMGLPFVTGDRVHPTKA
jgi:TolB-like protein/DNA-binding winged helix-turn-helix (wHTH) protein/tetratricopeptide (TPR) repeat protein